MDLTNISTYENALTAFSCQAAVILENLIVLIMLNSLFLWCNRLSTHQNIEFTHKNLKAIYAAIKLLHARKCKFIRLFDPNYPCLLKQIYSP